MKQQKAETFQKRKTPRLRNQPKARNASKGYNKSELKGITKNKPLLRLEDGKCKKKRP